MRKTSHDGGDSTSVTSGTENEFKKSAMKPKKSSLKRKCPNFSNDSDDPVNEPLLQKDKKKTETSLSAKLFTKGKTDSLNEKEDDKAKLLNDNKGKTTTTTEFCGTTESLLSIKDSEVTKIATSAVSTIRNYMNTNVFNSHDNAKVTTTTKSSILVEINGTKQSGYSPTPLIFTTAKIHTDGKSKNMEPVQVTPVPILSTIEVSMSKTGNINTNEKKISNESSVISPVYSTFQFSKGKDEEIAVDNLSTKKSPTSGKETLGLVLVTSANIIKNKNPVQSNSNSNKLPSITSKPASVTTETKLTTTNDYIYEQTSTIISQPPKVSNTDYIKNNVTVKTTTISPTKSCEIKPKISKTSPDNKPPDKSISQKLDLNPDKFSISSNNPVSTSNNIKSPNTSKSSSDVYNTSKSNSSNGNKQLQRQKITTDEPSIVESKMKPNIELADNLSAKTSLSNNVCLPNVIDSTFTKVSNKLPQISANNNQNIKSPVCNTAISTSNITYISTSSEPTVSSASLPTTVSAQVNTSSKSSNIPVSLISINKTNPVISNTVHSNTAIDKSSVLVSKFAIPSLISAVRSPEVTLVQTSSSNSSNESVRTTTTSTSAASFVNSKNNTIATKQITPAATSVIVKTTIKPTDTNTETTVTKTLFADATTAKITPITSVLNTSTKPSSITSQVTCNIQPTVIAPITTATTTAATSVSKNNSPSNTTTIQMSPCRQTVPSTSTFTTSEKSSSVNNTTLATRLVTIKSPNNNTSIPVAAKSTTPISKSTTSNISTKTSKISSIPSVVNASAVKSPTESKVLTMKEVSAKKNISNTATPTEKNKSTSSAKSPNKEASNIPSVGAKSTTTKQSATTNNKVVSKSSSVTTTSKSPSVTIPTDVMSVNTTSTSASTTKPNTLATQPSANKPFIGTLSTSVSRPESIKKGGSKSSDNNKDGKVSKA